jgi:hypothetical protein
MCYPPLIVRDPGPAAPGSPAYISSYLHLLYSGCIGPWARWVNSPCLPLCITATFDFLPSKDASVSYIYYPMIFPFPCLTKDARSGARFWISMYAFIPTLLDPISVVVRDGPLRTAQGRQIYMARMMLRICQRRCIKCVSVRLGAPRLRLVRVLTWMCGHRQALPNEKRIHSLLYNRTLTRDTSPPYRARPATQGGPEPPEIVVSSCLRP